MGTKGQRGGSQNTGCRWTWQAEEKQHIAEALGFPDPVTAICRMYTDWEFSTTEIGMIFGVNRKTISYRLRQNAVSMRGKGGPHSQGKFNPHFRQVLEIRKEFVR
jgi:hypothetical protein